MPTVAYHTLGCKVNQYETEKIRESLEAAGFRTVSFSSRADAYVINTCTVTGVADGKSRAAVRRALRANPEAYVVVSGCYAQLEPLEIARIKGVDLVVPNDEKHTIAERTVAHFVGMQNEECRMRNAGPILNSQFSILNSVRPRTRTRAIVKVQDGCDQFCSYCIVPHARSGKRSRPLSEVLDELRALAAFGYREIVLTGIRLGSYEDSSNRLPELIGAASSVDGIERIRLSSVEPWEVDDALLDAMSSPSVCRHLHIPLQSGDDDVLRRMNRPYDSARYLEIIDRVRERIPGIGITTDVIAGFPGETDEAFANTCRLIELAGFSRIHAFRYSARGRTAAAGMPGQIDAATRKRRCEILTELGRLAMRRFAESMIGQTLDVLAERSVGKFLTGYTDNYVETQFPGEQSRAGRIAKVQIIGVQQDATIADCRLMIAD